MKVLHFFKTYYPDSMGGIEQVIFQLAEGCIKHGVESEVLSLSRAGAVRGRKVANHLAHCSRLDMQVASTGFSLSAFKDFKELARNADIVHYHFPWPYMDLVHFASGVNKPSIVTYHSDIVKQKFLLRLYNPLMNRFLNSVDSIVASSPNYVESSPVLQNFKDKISVIPFGLEKDTYVTPSAEKLAFWRNRLGSRFFLFVGALRYYKGLNFLLDAAHQTNLPVVILGSGPLEAELKQQAERFGVSNVHFLGGLPDEDKCALLSLCYALVFPSHLRSEAFGISLLEAAMYGKPMISCEIGTGTSYINISEETGVVIPPRNSSALAEAMLRLWSNSELAEAMGAAAAIRCEKHFAVESMVSSYSDLYRSLI
nr:glycosyltransferase family 4 protein [Pseudomonas sp. K2I15]